MSSRGRGPLSVIGSGNTPDVDCEIHHFLFRDGNGVVLPDHGGNFFSTGVFLAVLCPHQPLQLSVIGVKHLVFEQPLGKELQMCDKARIMQGSFIQFHSDAVPKDTQDLLDQEGSLGSLI